MDPMKRFLLAAAFALAATVSAHAASFHQGQIEVDQAWSRPSVAGVNGVGYMTVVNHGKAANALVRVESPAAARVEMHSSSMAGGVMSMAKEDRVAIPPGGQASFAPGGGHHLMLIGLKAALKPGDQVPATLVFASGAKLKIALTVSDGAGPPAMAGMDHMNHH
jgi:hypothetical protein